MSHGPIAAVAHAGSRSEERSDGSSESSAWTSYVLRCQDDTLYCGITNDLKRRVGQHDQGKGARYIRARGPEALLKSWPTVS